MRGDFTRLTFDRTQHFSRVLRQQGRVTVDADDNEQTAILLHYLRTLTRDLVGPYAAPVEEGGFVLADDGTGTLTLSRGRMYVDGILVENEAPYTIDQAVTDAIRKAAQVYWFYLDVWERHVTFTEFPHIRESALGGPDTSTRAEVVWQVRALPGAAVNPAGGPPTAAQLKVLRNALDQREAPLQAERASLEASGASPDQLRIVSSTIEEIDRTRAAIAGNDPAAMLPPLVARDQELLKIRSEILAPPAGPVDTAALDATNAMISVVEPVLQALRGGDPAAMDCDTPIGDLVRTNLPTLTARVNPGKVSDDPCVLAPDARYRGRENQLYRVEVHQGGAVGDPVPPTFKWSRDNGSIASAWLGTAAVSSGSATIDLVVADGRGFDAGAWVEVANETQELAGQPGVLARLTKVEGNTLSVDPTSASDPAALTWSTALVHPTVRRWDEVQVGSTSLTAGAVLIQETPAAAPASQVVWIDLEDGIQVSFGAGGEYQSGDYWLIPARVATGQIEWPDGMAQAPRGISHHYAPLGFVWWQAGALTVKGCRCTFEPGRTCGGALNLLPAAPQGIVKPVRPPAVRKPSPGPRPK